MKGRIGSIWSQKIDTWQAYYPDIVHLGIALCVGMIIGFCMRQFGRLIIVVGVVVVATVFYLEHVHLVSLHFDQAKIWLGLAKHQPLTGEMLFNGMRGWMQANPSQAVGSFAGFFLGWRMS